MPGTIALVLAALAWRWAITLSGILAPARVPELELETIAASHFVEKVRWCMDRLGVEYSERQMVGVLGVFFTGRSVPQLKIRTGLVRSTIGNSPEILRYLWAANEGLLAEIDQQLFEGQDSILGGDVINFTDITFASLSALWLQPLKFANGRANAVRIERDRVSVAMRADIERWIESYPNVCGFINRLYEQERHINSSQPI